MHIVIDARNRRSSTGRYTDRLLEHLQAIDHSNRYTILLSVGDSWQGSNKNFSALPCDFKQFSFNPLDQVRFAWLLYRLRPNLVHFTMTQAPLLYFGNIVTTTHDLTMLRYTRPGKLSAWLHYLRMLLYRFMFWWNHRKSKKIIVPSKFVAEDLAKLQPFTRNKIMMIYEASEPPIQTKAKPLKGVRSPFIFHVGSPFPHKNIDRLVKAFEQLKVSYPDLQLVLPGKKEYYFHQLESRIKSSSVAKDIRMPGYISDAELKWLYQNTECYVLPSLSEGFGLPGLEAMAHGCPLVSSDATCLPEIYGDAAHYFDPTNITDIQTKLAEVINDKSLRTKLVKNGAARLKKYSWQKMAEETLAVYKRTLDR